MEFAGVYILSNLFKIATRNSVIGTLCRNAAAPILTKKNDAKVIGCIIKKEKNELAQWRHHKK